MKVITHRGTILLILLLSAGWVIWSRAEPGGSERFAAPRVGFMAPDFNLTAFDGRAYHLHDLRGQVVIVNLWASWCGPCQAEMPTLEQIYREYHAQGLELLGVNATLTQANEEAQARRKAEEWGLTFPLLLDPDGSVLQQYEGRSLPSTFLIDAQGVVQKVIVGGPISEALLRIEVEKLLALSPKGGP